MRKRLQILSLLENATVTQMVDLLRPVLFVSAVVQLVQKGWASLLSTIVQLYIGKRLLTNVSFR